MVVETVKCDCHAPGEVIVFSFLRVRKKTYGVFRGPVYAFVNYVQTEREFLCLHTPKSAGFMHEYLLSYDIHIYFMFVIIMSQ